MASTRAHAADARVAAVAAAVTAVAATTVALAVSQQPANLRPMNEPSPAADGGSSSGPPPGPEDAASDRNESDGEHDRPGIGWLIVAVVFVVVSVVALSLLTWRVFETLSREEQARKLDVSHEQLDATRHRARNVIGSYAATDPEHDRYRVPVDRAIELIAREPELLRAPVPKGPAAAMSDTGTTGGS